MNGRNLALGVFVVLTVLFAALSAVGFSQKSSSTTTVISSTTITSTLAPTVNTSVTVVTTTITTGGNIVTFVQQGTCSPTEVYVAPWSLTIRGNASDGSSISIYRQLPVSGPAPVNGGFTASSSNVNYTMMTFSLPAGAYSYDAVPHGAFVNPTENFTVVDSNHTATFVLLGLVVSCNTSTMAFSSSH